MVVAYFIVRHRGLRYGCRMYLILRRRYSAFDFLDDSGLWTPIAADAMFAAVRLHDPEFAKGHYNPPGVNHFALEARAGWWTYKPDTTTGAGTPDTFLLSSFREAVQCFRMPQVIDTLQALHVAHQHLNAVGTDFAQHERWGILMKATMQCIETFATQCHTAGQAAAAEVACDLCKAHHAMVGIARSEFSALRESGALSTWDDHYMWEVPWCLSRFNRGLPREAARTR